jgi:hypothetical protein
VTRPRNGDVGKSGIHQVGASLGVGIDQHMLGGDALSAMTGHGVAMIEVTIFGGIEFYCSAFFQMNRKNPCRRNALDGRQFAIGDPDFLVGSGKLHAIAGGNDCSLSW